MPQDPDEILTAYQAKLDEIVAAVEAQDFLTANIKVVSAKAIRAKLIESEIADNGTQLKLFDDLLKEMVAAIGNAEISALKYSTGSRFGYARNRMGSSYR